MYPLNLGALDARKGYTDSIRSDPSVYNGISRLSKKSFVGFNTARDEDLLRLRRSVSSFAA